MKKEAIVAKETTSYDDFETTGVPTKTKNRRRRPNGRTAAVRRLLGEDSVPKTNPNDDRRHNTNDREDGEIIDIPTPLSSMNETTPTFLGLFPTKSIIMLASCKGPIHGFSRRGRADIFLKTKHTFKL